MSKDKKTVTAEEEVIKKLERREDRLKKKIARFEQDQKKTLELYKRQLEMVRVELSAFKK